MTAGGGQWAEAEVGVTLNWDNVEGELKRRLEQASAKAALAVRKNWAKLEVASRKSFERMATGFASQMRDMERDAGRASQNINKSFARIKAPRIKLQVDTSQALRDVRDAHKQMQAWLLANPLVVRLTVQADMAQLRGIHLGMQAWLLRNPLSLNLNIGGKGGGVGKLAKMFLGPIATISKFAAIAGAATVAVAGLTPAVAALGAALGSALFSTAVAGAGAFAAGLTAVVGIVATVKTATAGVGEAIKNAFDPANAEKFAEAMAKLAPQAQAFVRAFQSLGKEFKTIVQQPVQDAFFAGLGPQIDQLRQHLVPVRDAMLTIADGFNEGAKSALQFINSTRGISTLSTLLRESANMGANLGSALGNLVPGLLAIGAGASSVFGPMTNGFAASARSLSDMLVAAQQSGAMAQYFQDAIGVAKQLWFVMQQVGGIISAVFSAAAEAGNGVLGGLATQLQTINAYLSAGEGREALVSFFQSMAAAVGTVLPILLQLAGIIGSTVAPAIAGLVTAVGPAVSGLVTALGQGLAAIAPAMAPLGAAISSIATALTPVLPVVGQLIAQFVQLAGPIVGALAAALGPILQSLGTALTGVFQALMPAIQPITQVFQALSPVIAQIATTLGSVLASAVSAIVPVFSTLAGVVAQLLPAIQPLIPIIGDLLVQAIQLIAPIIQQMATAWAGMVTALLPLIPPLMQIVQALLPPLVQIIGALLPLVTMVALTFTKLVTAIAPLLVVLAQVLAFVARLVGAFLGFVATVLGAVVGFVTGLVGQFTGMISTVIGAVTGWVSSMWSAVSGFVTTVVTAVSGFVADVIGFFTNLAQTIGSTVSAVWTNVTGFFRDGIEGAKTLVSNGLDAVVGFFKNLPGRLKEFAGAIWEPIRESARTVFNAIAGLWNNTVGKLSFRAPDWVPGIGGKGFDVPDIPMMRTGGLFRGVGTGTSDSNLVALSDGEWVNPAAQTNARTMPWLQAIRAGWTPPKWLTSALLGGGVQKLAEGGQVGGREAYGLPVGSSVSYGDPDKFPEWVHALEKRFGVQASTYPGHQEKSGQNKGIDWSGPVANMQRFAEFALSNKGDLEQVIWMNPQTGQQIGVADGQQVGPGTSQSGYYRDDWSGHTDHVHTRQSYAWGGGNTGPAKGIDTSGKTASTPSLGGSTTPIGSGLGGSPSGSSSAGSSSPSWGNSGGGSKFNSAEEADKGGVVPVWVENWPAIMGGGAAATPSGSPTLGGTPDPAVGLTGKPSTVDTIPLKKNKDGTWTSTDPEWAKLIARESGGRADRVQEIQDANSGGNEASGLFQIAKGTWAANGGTKFAPTAGQATPEQQAEVAARIFNKSGGSPWGSGAGQNFGREDEAKLRAGIQRAGKGTPAPKPSKNDPMPVTVTNTPDVTTTPDSTTATPAPATTTTTTPKRPTLDAITLGGSSFSGQAGGAAKAGTKYAIDSVLFDNPGALGKFDNSKAQTSLGARAGDVANTAVSGQLGAALGIFGLDLQPPILDAVGQYITDNPLTTAPANGERPATQKNLVDLAHAIIQGQPLQVIVNNPQNGDEVVRKVDQDRRRRMRRYVK